MLLPVVGEECRVIIGARAHAHEDAALPDARLVALDALFRDAPADECADQASGSAARTRAGNRRSEWAGNDETETRDSDSGADCSDRGENCADRSADRSTHSRAFCRLAAQFSLRAVDGAEV